MKDPHRLSLVRWRDAHSIANEDSREETLKSHRPVIYWTAGVLVQSDAMGITIAQDLGMADATDYLTYRTRTFIPRELVEEEFDLGPVIRTKRVRQNKAGI